MRLTRDEARHYHEDDEDPAEVFAAFDAAEREGRLGVTASWRRCLVCCQWPIGWIWPYWFVRWHVNRVKEGRDIRLSDPVNFVRWLFWMRRHPDGKGP